MAILAVPGEEVDYPLFRCLAPGCNKTFAWEDKEDETWRDGKIPPALEHHIMHDHPMPAAAGGGAKKVDGRVTAAAHGCPSCGISFSSTTFLEVHISVFHPARRETADPVSALGLTSRTTEPTVYGDQGDNEEEEDKEEEEEGGDEEEDASEMGTGDATQTPPSTSPELRAADGDRSDLPQMCNAIVPGVPRSEPPPYAAKPTATAAAKDASRLKRGAAAEAKSATDINLELTPAHQRLVHQLGRDLRVAERWITEAYGRCIPDRQTLYHTLRDAARRANASKEKKAAARAAAQAVPPPLQTANEHGLQSSGAAPASSLSTGVSLLGGSMPLYDLDMAPPSASASSCGRCTEETPWDFLPADDEQRLLDMFFEQPASPLAFL